MQSRLTLALVCATTFAAPLAVSSLPLYAQDAATAVKPAVARQAGTVKSAENGTLTIVNATGVTFTITPGTPMRVLQLAPGSTDLKSATPTTIDQVSVGDRVLVAGKAGDGNAITATQVVLMKGSDIAQRNAAIQADWQKRGSGGIVSAVDTAAGTITIKSGAKTIAIQTAPTTIYRRYAPGSVKFEEAVSGTMAQIAVGDQLQVRGNKSADGTSVTAEEIVSGGFSNISGLIATLDADSRSFTVKDLATKKTVTVKITQETDLRQLPPEMATRLAARLKSGGAQHPAGPAAAGSGSAGAPASGAPASGGPGAQGEGGMRRGPGGAGGGDFSLAAMIPRLPTATLADLKQGEALMIVASKSTSNEPLSAITVLAGVEAILTASPTAGGMTLSPWSLGSGGAGGESAGGGGPQ